MRRRYRRTAAEPAQHVQHDENRTLAPVVSQPAAGSAAAESAGTDTRHQKSSEAAEPAARATVSVAAEPETPGCTGNGSAKAPNAAGQPGAEAGSGVPVIRVFIDEARGLPEAASGAQARAQRGACQLRLAAPTKVALSLYQSSVGPGCKQFMY